MSINTCSNCITPYHLDLLIWNTTDDPKAPAKYLYPEDEGDDYERPEPSLRTERNWLGIHSLLSSDKWAKQPLLGESIAGGTPFGCGYCYEDAPVRYFTVRQVGEIAVALETVEEEALRASCDLVVLNAANVPPAGGWREGDFCYLWETFSKIRDFFRMAQTEGYAVLVYVC